MNVRICLVFCFYLIKVKCLTNLTTSTSKRANPFEEDYYLNYDYDVASNTINNKNNNTFEDNFKLDPLLLPNPESIDSKYTVDVLPNIELPDDSLADTDLKDHDFIDNLMYVYYGSHNRSTSNCGPEVIIIGSVLSCAAQLLTIFCVLLKKNLNGKKEMRHLFLHLMTSLCFSNLIFMLGVYATKNFYKCLSIAFVLHYFHLLTAFWMFLYCYYIYKRFSNSGVPSNKIFYSVGYGMPLIFAMLSYLVAPYSFETKRFCFMSVQKGMIINYMLPVSFLIVITTVYSLNGIRKINIELSKLEFSSSAESLNALRNDIDKRPDCIDEEVVSLRELKTCLKILCGIQTGYDIVWFIVVLALENNSDSNSMSIVYSVTSCILNWYIFLKTKSFLPTIIASAKSMENISVRHHNHQEEKMINFVHNGSGTESSSSDNIPLLVNTENCTEMRELRLDYISTISN